MNQALAFELGNDGAASDNGHTQPGGDAAGAALGEMSMLDAAPLYATCTAIEEVQAGVLTRQTIGRLIQEHPAVGAKLLVKLTQLLAQRLRNTSNQLVRLIQNK